MVQRIDVHAHFLPERYRAALAAAGHSKPSGVKKLSGDNAGTKITSIQPAQGW